METMETKRDEIARLWNPPHRTQSMGHGYILEVVYGNGPPIPGCSITSCHTPHQNVSLALLGRIKGRTIHKICEFSPEIYTNSAWIKIVPRHNCIVTMSNCIAPENNNQCMKYPIMPGQPQLATYWKELIPATSIAISTAFTHSQLGFYQTRFPSGNPFSMLTMFSDGQGNYCDAKVS